MRHKVVTFTGYALFGLLIVGLGMEVFLAATRGHPWYGVNAYGLNLGVYPTMAVLIVLALVGVVAAVGRIASILRRRRGEP